LTLTADFEPGRKETPAGRTPPEAMLGKRAFEH